MDIEINTVKSKDLKYGDLNKGDVFMFTSITMDGRVYIKCNNHKYVDLDDGYCWEEDVMSPIHTARVTRIKGPFIVEREV